MTLDLRVMVSNPTLGVDITKEKLKPRLVLLL